MDLSQLGEFGLIEEIKSRFATPEEVTGIGDDCAILPQHLGRESLVSTDMLIEGTHFLMEDITPYQLGWKSAAVNISDIAAMGGRPVATFLALALPSFLNSDWVEEFLRGYGEISDKYNCPLLGGDTTSSPDRISICVTIIGETPKDKARKRDKAEEGDLICVTGTLGDSAAGLKIILDNMERDELAQKLIKKHYLPQPRVIEGMDLASSHGIHAMMDISDGIGSDLRHILKASCKGAVIDTTRIPVSAEIKTICQRNGWDVLDFAVNGGEDYELMFTVTPDAEKNLNVKHWVIGQISKETDGIIWMGSEKQFNGYNHFSN